jgi:hypothetical protein
VTQATCCLGAKHKRPASCLRHGQRAARVTPVDSLAAAVGCAIHPWATEKVTFQAKRVYYESRLARLELKASERPKIDPEFEEATEGEEVEHKEKLKSKWAQFEAVVGSENWIKLIARDPVGGPLSAASHPKAWYP